MTKKNKMLPSGFKDLLFNEASDDYYIKNSLTSYFLECGFGIIKTPLLEFKDNFDPKQLSNSFSTTDILSGSDLVLRSDITLQIARLFETRLKDVSLPLKLCYEGDVFLTKNDELYSDRQLTQSGFEIVGCENDDYLQVIEMSMDLVSKLVNKKCVLEVSVPNFAKTLCDSLNIDYSEDLQSIIKRKNLTDLRKTLGNDLGDVFCDLVINFTDLDSIFNKISKISNSKNIINSLSKLSLIRQLVENNHPDVEICYDVFGDNSGSYHKDIAFKVFCQDYSYPILKGGKYQIRDIDCAGATFYVNHIRKIGA